MYLSRISTVGQREAELLVFVSFSDAFSAVVMEFNRMLNGVNIWAQYWPGSLVLHANFLPSLWPWQLVPCQCRYWANQARLPIPFLISHPLDPGWDEGGPAGEPGWVSKQLLAAYLQSRLPTLGTYCVPVAPCQPFAWLLQPVELLARRPPALSLGPPWSL